MGPARNGDASSCSQGEFPFFRSRDSVIRERERLLVMSDRPDCLMDPVEAPELSYTGENWVRRLDQYATKAESIIQNVELPAVLPRRSADTDIDFILARNQLPNRPQFCCWLGAASKIWTDIGRTP